MDSSGHRPSTDAIAISPVRLSDAKMLRRLAIMILIMGAVLGALYFFKTMRDTAIKNIFSRLPPPTAVAMTRAETQTVPRFLTGIGTIAAVHQVTVASQLSGMVTQILFAPGQVVKTGDPLVQLDDGPEQGDLRNFEAQARYAAVTLRRNQELLVKQAAAQSVVDQNQSQLDQANASIARTKALIAQKLIRAPFSGRLGVRQVEVGQYVGAGTAMVTLTDLSQLYVNFTLPEQDAGALVVDQEVSFTVDAYPGQSFTAKINAIEPQVSADTRAIKLQATTANSDDKLLPGMFANAHVVLPPRVGVVTVPETAVENTLYGDSVYIIEQGGSDAAGKPVLKAKRVAVKTGEHVNGRIAILDGVKPGDAVVALGQNKVLFDGAAVTPNEQGGLALPAQLPNN
jgi:membrane fusion protein, multidrug efflux system